MIGPWFAPRYEQGGVYEAIARHRARKLYAMVWRSGSNDAPFHARSHQVVLSLGVPASAGVGNEELTHAREGLIAMLRSLNLGVFEYEPQDLIALIDDLTSPTTAPQDDAVPYNPNDPIAAQATRSTWSGLSHTRCEAYRQGKKMGAPGAQVTIARIR